MCLKSVICLLYIRAAENQRSRQVGRIRQYSWVIRDQMADQELGGNLRKSHPEYWMARRWLSKGGHGHAMTKPNGRRPTFKVDHGSNHREG